MKTFFSPFGRCCGSALALGLLLGGPAVAQAPAWQWGLQSTNPAPTDGSEASGNAVATDVAGRVYVAGQLTSNGSANRPLSRSFGSLGSLTGPQRGFVAQASAAGQWAWLLPVVAAGPSGFGGPQARITGITVGTGGEVYAAGFAVGDSLQVGSRYYRLPASGGVAFVLRLNNTGAVQWLRSFATSSAGYQLAADPSTGGVVLAGAYQGITTIGTVTLPPGINRFEGSPFIARLDAGGNWRGAVSINGTSSVGPEFVMTVGPAGQVALVGGQYDGSLSFGPNLSLSVPSSAMPAYFAAQLSPTNIWDWAIGGTTGKSQAYGAAYTPTGTLWVGGSGGSGAVIGPLTVAIPGATSPNASAGYLGLLSATGQWLLARPLIPSADGFGVFVWLRTDAGGNALALGVLRGNNRTVQANLGGQTLTSPANDGLIFVAGLSPTGQWRYVASLPNSAAVDGLEPGGIALAPGGALYLTGSLHDAANFGPFALTGTTGPAGNTSQGSDLFLAKLANATALAVRAGTAAPTLALFPNPARSTATLRLPAPTETAAEAVLTDALGREVRRYAVPARATETTLDVTGLAPGLYLVRCGAAVGRLVVE